MYPPQTIEELKLRHSTLQVISQLDGWEKIIHHGTYIGVIMGVILYGIFNPFGASSYFFVIGIFGSSLIAGIMSLIFLTLIQHLWERIFK